jgi:hypothetical protein
MVATLVSHTTKLGKRRQKNPWYSELVGASVFLLAKCRQLRKRPATSTKGGIFWGKIRPNSPHFKGEKQGSNRHF